jgi:hypothetical protein
MAIKRIRWKGGTGAEWAAAPTTVLKSGEIGLDLTTGAYRIGDGVTEFSELAELYPGASLLQAAQADILALDGRVTALENSEPPPATATLTYACTSYIYPGSSGAATWAVLAANSAAGKLAYVIANPDNGPGYEATCEPGGSLHTHWTNRLSALTAANTKNLFYISTNYFDASSAHSGDEFAGTVGGSWRFTAATSDTITFVGDGTDTLGGAVGSSRPMTFAAGFGPVAVKSWYSGSSNPYTGTTLPGNLAASTSYWLRPTGATPIATYTLHTSKADAEANTGRVDITSTGGGSGLGPFWMGLRRTASGGSAALATGTLGTILAEMTRVVTLYGSLCHGWFFDECEVDVSGFDSNFDQIKAYRDANHPGLLLCMNGTPHNSTRAALYDVFVLENNWEDFKVPATTTLTLTGVPSNTQTITIAGKVYTWQTTLTNTDGNVFIGASAAACCTNLIAAVTLGSGAGTKYAAATVVNATCDAEEASGDTVRIMAKVHGAAANGTAVTETMSNATLSSGTLTGGDDTGPEATPSYILDDTIPPEKCWAMIHDDVKSYDLADIVAYCVTNKMGVVYINGPSAYSALPTDGADGFDQDDVLAAIDVANA